MPAPALERIFNSYDAADDNTNRSFLVFPRNSRFEINHWTRSRLQEKARSLEANFEPITRIRSKFGRAVAGRGITPFPTTDDPAFNTAAKALFDQWATNPLAYSIDGSRSMWEDQRIIAEELGAGDGETFHAFVTGPDGQTCIQPLDPFEITTPFFGLSLAGYNDGVLTDQYLRPVAYAVRELRGPFDQGYDAAWRTIPAENLIHLFRRRRAKQLRGLPPMYSGINTGNDALDSKALETATAKLHSLLAVFMARKPANKGTGLTNQLRDLLNSDGTLDHREEKFAKGAAVIEGDEGETLQLLNSSRPSQNWVEGMKFCCLLISLGVDLPYSVVMGFAGLGGTGVRGEIVDAQNVFELRQDAIVYGHSRRIRIRKLAEWQESGALPRCTDPVFWKANWHGPAKLTTDYGYDTDSDIARMKTGLLAAPRFYEERDQDAYEEGRKHIDWLAAMQLYATEKNVDFSRFMESTPGAGPQQQPGGNQPPGKPPKKAPPAAPDDGPP